MASGSQPGWKLNLIQCRTSDYHFFIMLLVHLTLLWHENLQRLSKKTQCPTQSVWVWLANTSKSLKDYWNCFICKLLIRNHMIPRKSKNKVGFHFHKTNSIKLATAYHCTCIIGQPFSSLDKDYRCYVSPLWRVYHDALTFDVFKICILYLTIFHCWIKFGDFFFGNITNPVPL